MRVCGRAEVQRSGCSGAPGWGVSSPGEGLPPRGRQAGGRVRAAPSPAPRSWLSSRGGLPVAARQATHLCPAAGSLAARVRCSGAGSARPRSAEAARATPLRPRRECRAGPGAKTRSRSFAALALRAEPFTRPSTSRGTLTTSPGPRLHVLRTSALSRPGAFPLREDTFIYRAGQQGGGAEHEKVAPRPSSPWGARAGLRTDARSYPPPRSSVPRFGRS